MLYSPQRNQFSMEFVSTWKPYRWRDLGTPSYIQRLKVAVSDRNSVVAFLKFLTVLSFQSRVGEKFGSK